MNLRDLQYLVAVADEQHIGKAAKACNVSQPTLSIQLKKLEDTLGVALFERLHKSIRLTSAGEQVVQRARLITQEAQALISLARSLQDPLAGEFRLGAFPTLAPYYLPKAVPLISQALPKLRLLLVEDKTDRLLSQLDAGTLDAALLALPITDKSFDTALLFEEPFMLAVPTKHKLAKAKQVTSDDLGQESLLLLEDGHCLRSQALEICSLIGVREQAGFRATSLETLRQMVGAGTGVTLMPACAAQDTAQVKHIPFKNEPYTRQIGLVWRHSHPRAPLMRQLTELLAL